MIRNNLICNYLEVEDLRVITEQLIAARQEYSEDLPSFNTRYKDKLETIINQLKANYFGEELYKTIVNKAAALFYFIIKDHPFINGNKRIAVVALYEFLERNTQ
jgi:death-on-curing family protein